MNQAPPEDRFRCSDSYHEEEGDLMVGGERETTGLPSDAMYRVSTFRNKVRDPEILAKHYNASIDNSFTHMVGPGILVATAIFRFDNIQWNEIARAVYEIDHPIDTLRHIMFTHVVNEQSEPYIKYILYPRRGRYLDFAEGEACERLERGTLEYHEFLGTRLGKAAATLLISSFPRGTRCISRIVIWYRSYQIMVRVENEPLNANTGGQSAPTECR
ncbi:unnamed protein product [Penicillium nalgiovense]|nr:unnamed protein product [Penicillium nalgiovense]